ncbi:killer cell lectin-like receptor 2 [Onychomys torridus]|uniref:killer cell lectin-like receptor 2 n=1 Tax=Onychomys torridus TaxID=38674 RepID=UPI00167F3BC6|nr:killer cell lectin-like receptor 2 [Onychomys torridus]
MFLVMILMSLEVVNLLTSHCSGSWGPLLTSDDGSLGVADIHIVKKKYELQRTLNNLTENYHILQNDNYLKEEILRNKSRECDDLKHQKEPDSLKRKQNRCCGKTKVVLDCIQHTGKHVEGHLFCCGIKCYYVIMENKHWSGCKQTCQACSLFLLKTDDDDELKFLQSQVTTNGYWTGLKYNGSKGEWQWIGNVPSNLNLTTAKLLKGSGGCVYLSFGGIHEDDCGRNHPCICEKRMDKFPVSMYSVKVGIFKEDKKIGLTCHRLNTNGCTLEARICFEALRNFMHQTLEGELGNQKLSGFMIVSDFMECHSTRPVKMRFLHCPVVWLL